MERSRVLLVLAGLSAASCVSDEGSAGPQLSSAGSTSQAPVATSSADAETSDGDSADASTGEDTSVAQADGFVLGSVVITDAGRTTYVQVIDELTGSFDNSSGVEIPGNSVFLVEGRNMYAGLAEEPTWIKYAIGDDGSMEEDGRLSMMSYGLTTVDFGRVMVDSTTAVTISSDALLAIVWNPTDMTITGTIDLSHMFVDGYDLENWTSVAHEGLVYVPGRWANYTTSFDVLDRVMITIIDPKTLSIVGIAEDDRCASGGRIVFDADGYGYVMGDGRNYGNQIIAHAAGDPIPENCLLRIAPGETDFEADYFHTIPSLTGGLDSITELETGAQGSGIAFAKMFYPDRLPEGVEPVNFDFWNENAHRLWRIELGDNPTATEVEGAPFSVVGFQGSPTGGKLYIGESEDGGGTSTVYEVDPETNVAQTVFSMDGYFYGLHPLPAP
ncbi:MAG: hypothetical protein AAGA54_24595 [Myxococcota bacterium]